MRRKISKEKAKELIEKSKLNSIKDLIDSDNYALFTYKDDRIVKWKGWVGDFPIEIMLDVLNESISKYIATTKQIKENKKMIREWFNKHSELEEFLKEILIF